MTYRLRIGLLLVCILSAYAYASSSDADIIYLKNGGSVEGAVIKENARTIELETGFGIVAIARQDVKEIVRSSPDKIAKVRAEWDEKRVWLKGEEKNYARDRERRFRVYSKWVEEEEAIRRKGEGSKPGEVPIMRVAGSNSIFVDVILNGSINATFVLDTGADIVVLSRRLGESMGLDLEKKGDTTDLCLAGGRTVPAKIIMLKSVKIGSVEEKDVRAAVILDDAGGASFKDGLLGQTFLSRFNVALDVKAMKMMLERVK